MVVIFLEVETKSVLCRTQIVTWGALGGSLPVCASALGGFCWSRRRRPLELVEVITI
jgi:hypothetical protein